MHYTFLFATLLFLTIAVQFLPLDACLTSASSSPFLLLPLHSRLSSSTSLSFLLLSSYPGSFRVPCSLSFSYVPPLFQLLLSSFSLLSLSVFFSSYPTRSFLTLFFFSLSSRSFSLSFFSLSSRSPFFSREDQKEERRRSDICLLRISCSLDAIPSFMIPPTVPGHESSTPSFFPPSLGWSSLLLLIRVATITPSQYD